MHSVQALYCNWDCHWDCLRILGISKKALTLNNSSIRSTVLTSKKNNYTMRSKQRKYLLFRAYKYTANISQYQVQKKRNTAFLNLFNKNIKDYNGKICCKSIFTVFYLQKMQSAYFAFSRPIERKGRSCAGPQTMFDIFWIRGWDIICGPAQDRPLRSGSNMYCLSHTYLRRSG